jgi:hypothetical protein
MFTPIVTETPSALEAVTREPFLEEAAEQPSPATLVWHTQRALVEASLLRVPGRDEQTGGRRT